LRKRFALGYARPAKLALCSATEAACESPPDHNVIEAGYICVTAPYFDRPAAGATGLKLSAHWPYGGPSPQMPAFLRRAEAAASA
jgi:hypothetical protein